MLKCAVRKRDPLPRTEAELTEAMVEEWERLDMDKIYKILLTMRDQLAAVKRAHDAATPY
jgi:hypothetical protein